MYEIMARLSDFEKGCKKSTNGQEGHSRPWKAKMTVEHEKIIEHNSQTGVNQKLRTCTGVRKSVAIIEDYVFVFEYRANRSIHVINIQ